MKLAVVTQLVMLFKQGKIITQQIMHIYIAATYEHKLCCP